MGLGVTLVDPLPAPMTRIVGSHLGQRFIDLHREHGVQARLGTEVLAIDTSGGDVSVDLSDGSTVHADACVVGIGAIPNDSWLTSSALTLRDGVVCDEYGRASGAADVFAVGDVARWYDPRRGRAIRHEHWTNAYEQAQVLARCIIRHDDMVAHTPIEYVWSDQYDWKIRIAGQTGIDNAKSVEIVGDEATGQYTLLSSQDGTSLSGIVVINWPRALVVGRKALANSTALKDVAFALRDLLDTQPSRVPTRAAGWSGAADVAATPLP
jgi:3-phenylpropionate/trans-cinnamate dioxygenase ferredoxin reductase subunit